LNVLSGWVEALVPIEEAAIEVQLRLGEERLLARVTRRSGATLGLLPGREIFAVIKTVAIDRRSLGSPAETADLDEEVEVFDGE
jgi:molybdate transport system ATP-binding protein